MRLQLGQKAPLFSVVDSSGNNVSLEALRGRKVLLSFFRYASCPFCNLRVHHLSQWYEEWHARGLNMLAVFESPAASIAKRVGKQGPPFTIVPDPSLDLYRLYGVESSWFRFLLSGLLILKPVLSGFLPGKMEGNKAILPADFLIDENGVVQLAYYGGNLGDHIPISRIESFIEGEKL